MLKKIFNVVFMITSSLMVFSFTKQVQADVKTRMISLKVGSQYLGKTVEVARTKAEQEESVGVFAMSIEHRLPDYTWGVSISGYNNKWETKIPSNRTDGKYTVLTTALELKKSLRVYRDLFFFGGGGIGISFVDSNYNEISGGGDTNRGYQFTVLGNTGFEWRLDTSTIFLDWQWLISDLSSNSASGKYSRYPSIGGPRLMLGIGVFY